MAIRELICRLQRYGVHLFVYGFCILSVQPGSGLRPLRSHERRQRPGCGVEQDSRLAQWSPGRQQLFAMRASVDLCDDTGRGNRIAD